MYILRWYNETHQMLFGKVGDRGEEGGRLREYNRRCELGQSTLCTCMELSQ
jgi:hypothetical protein